ncbi:MAG: 50S ribosomal protein L18 [Candidatus Omnitrophica bacterium]|nr:50S ribosomal protein L18 [Candidatus Omnitrophota bacterium]MDD5436801.1 50S ribosomal protein L18 [Candidatus Omnitrophota bacterium]
MKKWIKIEGRTKRHKIIRKKVSGTSQRPRLSVYRSLKNTYVQLVDDMTGCTLAALSTSSPSLKDKIKKDGGNLKGAALLGIAVADLCKEKGITSIVFDRSGYVYHGKVKTLADALRKGGLKF